MIIFIGLTYTKVFTWLQRFVKLLLEAALHIVTDEHIAVTLSYEENVVLVLGDLVTLTHKDILRGRQFNLKIIKSIKVLIPAVSWLGNAWGQYCDYHDPGVRLDDRRDAHG